MPLRRFCMIVPFGLLGCQLLIGLDEGTQTTPGTGGAPSTSSTSASSGSHGGGGATSASSGTGGASSGTGGTSSSSASSGTGGGLVLDLIDDMEAGTGQILKVNGRAGSWFSYNDMTGTQVPAPGGPCLPEAFTGGGGAPGSTKAMHTTGMQFTSWGAGIGFDLNHPGAAPRQPYDASKHKGIVFWARSEHAAPIPPLHVRVLEPATVPASEGGTCVPADGGSPGCGDSHSAAVLVTSDWQRYELAFTAFHQVGWGVPASPPGLDPGQLLAIQFAVENTPDFDYWIDDVSFYD